MSLVPLPLFKKNPPFIIFPPTHPPFGTKFPRFIVFYSSLDNPSPIPLLLLADCGSSLVSDWRKKAHPCVLIGRSLSLLSLDRSHTHKTYSQRIYKEYHILDVFFIIMLFNLCLFIAYSIKIYQNLVFECNNKK